MARVNVGVNPKYLADQHLIAESVEITMITGSLRINDNIIKGKIPESFKLGKGHINFFKNKLLYLDKRLQEVNKEMFNRGFNHSTEIDLDLYPQSLINDWSPNINDSNIIRERICNRLITRKDGRTGIDYYRKNRCTLSEPELLNLVIKLHNSELHHV